MVSFTGLWLAILLAAVGVFLGSFILHVVLRWWHGGDYKQLPAEEQILAAMRAAGVKRGLYRFPFACMKDMKTPATLEKFKAGPVGTMTIMRSGPFAMPKYLAMWFIYCLIVSAAVACLVAHTTSPRFTHRAFHVTALASFLAYGVSQLVNGVWKGEPWGVVIKEVVDGFIYALITAAIFAWLWPS